MSIPSLQPIDTAPPNLLKKQIISIRWSLPLFVMAPVIIGITLTSWLAFRSAKHAIEDSIDKISQDVAANIEKEIDNFLKKPILLSESVLAQVQSGALNIQDVRELGRHLWQLTQSDLLTNNFYYGNRFGEMVLTERQENGSEIAILDEATDFQYISYWADSQGRIDQQREVIGKFDPRERPWYQKAARSQKPAWSDVYIDFSEGSLVLTRATPIIQSSGQVEGVLGIDIFLSELSAFLNGLTVSPNGQAFILDIEGNLIASSSDENLFIQQGESQVRLTAANSQNQLIRSTAATLLQKFKQLDGLAQQEFQFDLNGRPQLSQLYNLQNHGVDWLVVVTIPQDDYMTFLRASTRNTALIGMGITVVASLMALGAALYIIQPIEALNRAADEIKNNQFDPSTLTHVLQRPDEFSKLAEVFDEMAMVVANREQSLAEQVKHLETQRSQSGSGGDRPSLEVALIRAQQARTRYLATK